MTTCWATTQTNQPLQRAAIPQLSLSELQDAVDTIMEQERRVLLGFGERRPDGSIQLFIAIADDARSQLFITSVVTAPGSEYPALCCIYPQFAPFEREWHEEFGLLPLGHPWLKPLRYGHDRHDKRKTIANYPFFQVSGDAVHEVAVGPIHAGVIEPGHFRFQMYGEKILHLEIQLGYQHRGVEALFREHGRQGKLHIYPHLAESIAGDSAVTHALSCVHTLEALAGIEVSLHAQAWRAIALELERLAMHLADLGAIGNDIAYLTAPAVFGALRTTVINSALAICGSRFGRGWIRPGGVRMAAETTAHTALHASLSAIQPRIHDMGELFFASAGVLSRLDMTGIVGTEQAREIGLLGLAARASGCALDSRSDHPWGIYRFAPIHKRTMPGGDVFARSYLRYIEALQSIAYICDQVKNLPPGPALVAAPLAALQPNALAIGLTEGWRGEVAHAALTDEQGRICSYKVKDPSFCNWLGLALAVRGNDISDFPLCNKSFNLSYCGHDL